MEIQLDDKTMLGTDAYNWILYKKVANKKAEDGFIWNASKFYTSPGLAIKDQANREIRQSDASSLVEAIEEVNRIAKKYDDILTLLNDLK